MAFHKIETKEFGEDTSSFNFGADVAIVGAGCAGMYASYCCRLANIDCLIIDSLPTPGGQCIALYPEKKMYGVPGSDDLVAKEFIAKLSEQCLKNNEKKFFGYRVEKISKEGKSFKLTLEQKCKTTCSTSYNASKNVHVKAQYLILATGIGDMRPNIPQTIKGVDKISKESDFIQFYCINLTLYRGKDVIIAGGGDSAVDFAIDISSVAKSVTIIHRRDKFSCEEAKLESVSKLEKERKISIIFEHNISELREKDGIRIVKTIDKYGREHEFKTDHIVFCYGFIASLGNLAKDLDFKLKNNLIEVDISSMETSVENCYAAGDVVTYENKKKNVVPCFFEADRAVRAIKTKISRK